MDKATIKQKVCEAIAAHRADIEAIANAILAEPELGFKEVKTAKKVQDALAKLGLEFTTEHGLTGVKARMKGRTSKRTIAMLAELDAIVCRNHKNADPVTGAAHCCGHNIQIANMIAVAYGLREVMDELDGDVVLFAVPAEEYVEIDWRNAQRDANRLKYLGGKQQLIAEGAFDDIDMAMQMHVAAGSEFNLGASSNGFIGKLIEYHGRPAHAAFAPEEGINALNAAMMGVMGVNAIRETFRDQDHVRFHPIINAGGDLVNVIPDYVKMESYVRASNIEAMARYNKAVDRALKAGGDALGAKCDIQNLPGYLPLRPDQAFRDLLRENAVSLFGEDQVTLGEHSAGSTDMGDVSHLMPVVHPWVGCVDGVLHGADYALRDGEVAYTKTPQVLALTIVDLLAEGAEKAEAICQAFKPQLDRDSYVKFMDEIK
ncbi:MAG: amidohydrolase [Sutterella wadsworthensis]|nr:amidohydrolase [Sutterella wadsworthensis]